MIKINLLRSEPPKPTEVAGPPTTKAVQAVTFVGALVGSFLIVGVIYKIWSNQISELDRKLKTEKLRQTQLSAVKAQNERYQQRLRDLETRINTIQALQNSRVGPVELMNSLGNVVNRTSDVFLVTLAPVEGRVQLKGQAGSVESMANFLAFLQSSEFFQDVQMQQFFQDDQNNRLTYKFTVDFLPKSPAGAAGSATPATAPSPARPAPAARPVGR
jgi:Tfp pilus assembly protein PilN